MKATLYADGASLGNPGNSGVGAIITTDSGTHEISEYIGVATNNVAEYTALIRGVEEAKKLGVTRLDINLDSELLVKQVTGQYRVKNRNLKPLFVKLSALLGSLESYSIRHVPRENNTEADRLSKKGAKSGGKSPGKKHAPAEKGKGKDPSGTQSRLPF